MLSFILLQLKLTHKSNTTKNNNIIRFGWLLCCCCCPPPPPTIRIRLLLYSNVDEVDCCVCIPSVAAATVHDNCCIFSTIPPPLRLIVVLFVSFSTPAFPRPLSDWLLRLRVLFLWASLASILPDGGKMSPRAIVGSLVGSLGGDCDRCGRWINATAAAASRGDIRDGVGWIWGGLGGCLEAAGHGRGGGGRDLSGKKWREKSVEHKKIKLHKTPHQWCSKPPQAELRKT